MWKEALADKTIDIGRLSTSDSSCIIACNWEDFGFALGLELEVPTM